jgi:hypothetical protein
MILIIFIILYHYYAEIIKIYINYLYIINLTQNLIYNNCMIIMYSLLIYFNKFMCVTYKSKIFQN